LGKIKITGEDSKEINVEEASLALIDILRKNGYTIYAPCGGKGSCGKCQVFVLDEGNVMSCSYFPVKDIEIILLVKDEANILVSQTEHLEDVPFKSRDKHLSLKPYGVAIDIGTTTIVLYFLNLLTGRIERIASLLNPQAAYGADVISRISYCQEHVGGLRELQKAIVNAINNELQIFMEHGNIKQNDIDTLIFAGNTTMLHILLGEDPLSLALAPFTPKFTEKQIREGKETGLSVNPEAEVITLPCISAYVGADIVAGLSAIKPFYRNYLFLDIGTNGEMALIKGKKIFTCATAAGPAFEGASLSSGMGAVNGAVSSFENPDHFHVIGNSKPAGICGSGIVDIVAYLLRNNMIDETGLLKETFYIDIEKEIKVTQQDIREIQLAKSAIYSGIKVLMTHSGVFFNDIEALFLAGGFGNYINIESAIETGLLPDELRGKIYPVGNSAGIGALQYLKSVDFEERIMATLIKAQYLELSNLDEFTTEFALNMNFMMHKT
jgi:uncharacterized 2Fe-2S/4Fe-4S cluster protein (DUF4445 family)